MTAGRRMNSKSLAAALKYDPQWLPVWAHCIRRQGGSRGLQVAQLHHYCTTTAPLLRPLNAENIATGLAAVPLAHRHAISLRRERILDGGGRMRGKEEKGDAPSDSRVEVTATGQRWPTSAATVNTLHHCLLLMMLMQYCSDAHSQPACVCVCACVCVDAASGGGQATVPLSSIMRQFKFIAGECCSCATGRYKLGYYHKVIYKH